MIRVTVFKKPSDKKVSEFDVSTSEDILPMLVKKYGEDHSENYEIELEKLKNGELI